MNLAKTSSETKIYPRRGNGRNPTHTGKFLSEVSFPFLPSKWPHSTERFEKRELLWQKRRFITFEVQVCLDCGVAKGCSISWVAKVHGDENAESKLPDGWSRQGDTAGQRRTYTSTSPPLFRERPCNGEKIGRYQRICLFFAVEARVLGKGGSRIKPQEKIEKCLPAGTGTKIYVSSTAGK